MSKDLSTTLRSWCQATLPSWWTEESARFNNHHHTHHLPTAQVSASPGSSLPTYNSLEFIQTLLMLNGTFFHSSWKLRGLLALACNTNQDASRQVCTHWFRKWFFLYFYLKSKMSKSGKTLSLNVRDYPLCKCNKKHSTSPIIDWS